ncbi:plasmid mobilization relaxosome protein MobC [Niallia circulans]|uniref:plasmid mobilization relaxosome protein MobC n=1 Tax=Niallia circulans TaxID=1397 RepID=UPI002E1B6505|nr:plasmid mobilization relaxosome protein MobC [Niallia circulans]
MGNLKEVKFRLTEQEFDKAKKTSLKYGMTINAIAKFLVLNLEMPKDKKSREETKDLNRQVGAIGNNLNQMAKRLNSTSMLLPNEKKEVISLLKEIRNNTRLLAGKEPIEEDKEDIIYQHKSIFK